MDQDMGSCSPTEKDVKHQRAAASHNRCRRCAKRCGRERMCELPR
jgi:hypothetical protein